jgi:hypothetical protein
LLRYKCLIRFHSSRIAQTFSIYQAYTWKNIPQILTYLLFILL